MVLVVCALHWLVLRSLEVGAGFEMQHLWADGKGWDTSGLGALRDNLVNCHFVKLLFVGGVVRRRCACGKASPSAEFQAASCRKLAENEEASFGRPTTHF